MARSTRPPNWRALLRSWDVQQEVYNPLRERRFQSMFDVLEVVAPRRFSAIDLGSGPGSLSQRLLRRFPRSRSVAVDYDPVTRRIGQGALGSMEGRLEWADADLATPGWSKVLPHRRFDVAVSTTALHWLTARQLGALYAELGGVLPKGAVFLNGDHIPWGPQHPGLAEVEEKLRKRYRARQRMDGWRPWKEWWAKIEKIDALRPEFEERARRMAEHPDRRVPPLEVHLRSLRRAGFRDEGIVWDIFGNRILFAQR